MINTLVRVIGKWRMVGNIISGCGRSDIFPAVALSFLRFVPEHLAQKDMTTWRDKSQPQFPSSAPPPISCYSLFLVLLFSFSHATICVSSAFLFVSCCFLLYSFTPRFALSSTSCPVLPHYFILFSASRSLSPHRV